MKHGMKKNMILSNITKILIITVSTWIIVASTALIISFFRTLCAALHMSLETYTLQAMNKEPAITAGETLIRFLRERVLQFTAITAELALPPQPLGLEKNCGWQFPCVKRGFEVTPTQLGSLWFSVWVKGLHSETLWMKWC